MDRCFRISFFFLIILALGSCATVGDISGGQKDLAAPKVIMADPPSGSTHFKSKKIVLGFDEYFKLNDPLNNISVLPLGPQIQAKADKKKLILELDGELLENTTYQITFNNAIKDLNEGNDSLMHYVFSTGAFIDSLTYRGKVADAYSAEPAGDILVGLYSENDSIQSVKPRYFAKSNKVGEFDLSHLKAGKYRVYAFRDVNRDLRFQTGEKTGFREELLTLDSSYTDSAYILLFQNPQNRKLTHRSFVFPSQIRLAGNFDLAEARWYYEGKPIDTASIFRYRTDSITFSLPNKPQSDFYITSDFQPDTLFFRLNTKIKEIKYEVFPPDKDLTMSQQVSLIFSERIRAFNASLIRVEALDSSALLPLFNFRDNRFLLSFEKKPGSSVRLTLLPGAIQFTDGSFSDSISETFRLRTEKEFGTLVFVNFKAMENCLLEILKNEKVVRQISCAALTASPSVPYLESGEYSFRIIRDENSNGKWDGGDVLQREAAEKVLYFPDKVNIRANWETEVELEFNP